VKAAIWLTIAWPECQFIRQYKVSRGERVIGLPSWSGGRHPDRIGERKVFRGCGFCKL